MVLSRCWVDPKFKKRLKQEALHRGQTLTELTRELAQENDSFLNDMFKKKNEKKKRFDFRM